MEPATRAGSPPLRDLLGRARERVPTDAERIDRVLSLLDGHPTCFERDCWAGHVTASAWIVSHDERHFLLTHHRKLGRWLQLGGHADGDRSVVRVALREAREESGMQAFEIAMADGEPLVLDVDIHAIPERPGEPEHFHHDIRFLLRALPGQSLAISEESNDLRWFRDDDAERICAEESLGRLAVRAALHRRAGIRWTHSSGD